MKQLLISITFVLISTINTLGQNVDSLISIWDNVSQDDTSRLQAIDNIIKHYMNTNLDSASIFANKQLTLAQNSKYVKWKINATMWLARISYNHGDYSNTLLYSQRGINLAKETNDSISIGSFYRMTGMAHEMLGKNDSAKAAYNKSLSISLMIEDSILVSTALNSIGSIYYSMGEYDSSLIYFNRSLDIKRRLKVDQILISNTISNVGAIYFHKGDYVSALISLLESMRIEEKNNHLEGLVGTYSNIGNVYNQLEDTEKAINYYNKSINIAKEVQFKADEAMAKLNIGELYTEIGHIDQAREALSSGLELCIEMEQNYLLAYAYMYLGALESKVNNPLKSFEYYEIAYKKARSENIIDVLTQAATGLADLLLNKGQLAESRALLDEAEKQLVQLQSPFIAKEVYNTLRKYYSKTGETKKELEAYKNYIVFKDSVFNERAVRETTQKELEYFFKKQQLTDSLEYAKQQDLQAAKIEKEIIIRNYLSVLAGVLILIVMGIIVSNRTISKEKKRSENLLLNILPSETAEELKQNGKVDAKRFDKVTVLFTDFKEFTKLSENIDPEQLVKSIDFYYKAFDEIITKYGLEKIKTIGDSYMCAGGLPTITSTHVKDVVLAAKEMVDFVKNELKANDNITHFEIRVGIHSGPVVAGIVGIKKWQYDIWGDTVNIAARMETNSEPGMINVSETTYLEVKDEFECEYRGEIEVKHRGNLKMYFVV